MLYFTTLPRSPRCTEFYILFGGISSERNHIFTISNQPVKGFWFCEGSNFTISHRKAWSPLTRCLHYRAVRDTSSAVFLLLATSTSDLLVHTIRFCCRRSNVKPCLAILCIVRERSWSLSRCRKMVTLSCVALGGRIPAVYDQRYKCHNLRDGGRVPPATIVCCNVNSRHIGSESRFLPTPPAFDAPVRGVPVGILLCRLARKN